MMKKCLFIIPDLGHGGAEKVLVNSVNYLDKIKYDITVMTLYDRGVNKQFLNKEIHYISWRKDAFPGISHILKFFSPTFLYKHIVKDDYDIVISFLEGQTARIVSGCDNPNVKKFCWIHRTYKEMKEASRLFRSSKEALECYSRFDNIISVSEDVQKLFMNIFPDLMNRGKVLYNVNDTNSIIEKAKVEVDFNAKEDEIKLFGMGTIFEVKGFDRFIKVHARLRKEGFPVHSYILGEGQDKDKLINLIHELGIEDTFTLLGYQSNPYCYLKQADVFICSSHSEGFSTAVTEALVLGIPVVTTNVSGMHELLGDNEYGIITENNEDSLYDGIKQMFEKSRFNYYKEQAVLRGNNFTLEKAIANLENLLDGE